MYTRSQKHTFVKQCETCGQFNCCTHLPKQDDTKYYDKIYEDKVVKYLKPLLKSNQESNNLYEKTIQIHNIYNFILQNILFLVVKNNFLETVIKKTNEFKNNKKDLKLIGKQNLEYYLYWLNYIYNNKDIFTPKHT